MARIDRPLRVAALLALGACAAPAWRDLSEPVSAEDLAALPSEVTSGNASRVVRRCLQRHRDAATNVHRRYGYAFRPDGFVQLLALPGSPRDRHVRTFVDYARVESVSSETFLDPTRLRRSFRVTLRGSFRRWEAAVSPYEPQPAIGAEPETREVESFELVLDDPDAASRLAEAVALLRRTP